MGIRAEESYRTWRPEDEPLFGEVYELELAGLKAGAAVTRELYRLSGDADSASTALSRVDTAWRDRLLDALGLDRGAYIRYLEIRLAEARGEENSGHEE